jgi:phytoene synthase
MQQYMQQHGTSYYIANRFFPDQVREDVFSLYAFVRIPDDIVDEPGVDPAIARKKVQRYQELFHDVYHKNPLLKTKNPTRVEAISKAVGVFETYDIPVARADDFFAAMLSDLDKKVYATYEELQQYMYGSAEVIGLMMCKIIGYDKAQEAEVFRTAKLLGEAMQYTNFLRDIVEDSRDFDRLYIPEDRLVQHNLNHVLLTQYIA